MNRFKLSIVAAVLLAACLSAGCVVAVEVVPSPRRHDTVPGGSAALEVDGTQPGAPPGDPSDAAGTQSIAGGAGTCRATDTGAVLARAAYYVGKAIVMQALRQWTVLRIFD